MMLPPLESEAALIGQMTTPSPGTMEAVARLDGDVLILGVGGKMGSNLAELLVKAGASRVIGVSRFSNPAPRDYLNKIGVETVQADLLDPAGLDRLPDSSHLFILVGFKFGATGNEPETWATNALLPARLVQRFAGSNILYLSSGNVYGYSHINSPGSGEGEVPDPVGEYAQSRLGGERLVQFQASRHDSQTAIIRLFYATELRYGIIHDLAWKVFNGEPIDLTTGHVNQIWQGDALNYMAQMFPLCALPASIVNLTGRETLAVRWLAQKLGEELGREPTFIGKESERALLGDGSTLVEQLGPPSIQPEQIVRWMADWVQRGGSSLEKPTGYESRTGQF